MPKGEIVVGKDHLHVLIIFLDGFVLLLEALAHSQCHLVRYINSYFNIVFGSSTG